MTTEDSSVQTEPVEPSEQAPPQPSEQQEQQQQQQSPDDVAAEHQTELAAYQQAIADWQAWAETQVCLFLKHL